MPPTYVTAYNTTDSPVVIDEAGRTIGGHDWAPARRGHVLDDLANRGAVVVLTSIDRDSASPDARAANDRAHELNSTADALQKATAEQLRDAAGDLDPPPDDVDGLDKVDLIDLLARADVDPKTVTGRKATTTDPQEA